MVLQLPAINNKSKNKLCRGKKSENFEWQSVGVLKNLFCSASSLISDSRVSKLPWFGKKLLFVAPPNQRSLPKEDVDLCR
jgi:hypothetical protein